MVRTTRRGRLFDLQQRRGQLGYGSRWMVGMLHRLQGRVQSLLLSAGGVEVGGRSCRPKFADVAGNGDMDENGHLRRRGRA